MNDGWTEHRSAAPFDTPARFVVTGDTRSPEELAGGARRRDDLVPALHAPIPSRRRRPWRPEIAPASRTTRPRPPHLILRLVLIVGGPTLVITAALATGRGNPSPAAPTPPASPPSAATG